jgi:hypothetical protein
VKVFRWFLSFIAANTASFFAMLFGETVFRHVYYGGGILRSLGGLSPLVIKAAFCTFIFGFVGVLLAPSTKRNTAFVFFGLSCVFSAGYFDSYKYQDFGVMPFWLASISGVPLGALSALYIGLKIQAWKNSKAEALLKTNSAP